MSKAEYKLSGQLPTSEYSMNSAMMNLDQAVDRYTNQLASFEARAEELGDHALFDEIERATADVLAACAQFEANVPQDEISLARARFFDRTRPWFEQSAFMTRGRVWPRGYQGDYETLEWVYHGLPRSTTRIGVALDRIFLSRIMAIAARDRRSEMSQILRTELHARPSGQQILSIACGSCRDLFDIASDIRRHQARVTCVDRDPDALEYGRHLLHVGGIPTEMLAFQQLNALRLVSLNEALRRFGEQDIVYSVGFLDYLDDDRVARLLRAWYGVLRPGGALVVAMKDVTGFEPYTYRWLVDWTRFQGRRQETMVALFDAAEIPVDARSCVRDASGIIVFWRASRR